MTINGNASLLHVAIIFLLFLRLDTAQAWTRERCVRTGGQGVYSYELSWVQPHSTCCVVHILGSCCSKTWPIGPEPFTHPWSQKQHVHIVPDTPTQAAPLHREQYEHPAVILAVRAAVSVLLEHSLASSWTLGIKTSTCP